MKIPIDLNDVVRGFSNNFVRYYIEGYDHKCVITDFISIERHSDKDWNSEDVCHLKYDDIKFVKIDIFVGTFVLTFDCNVVKDGVDLAKKYKTEELDRKYANEEAKHEAIDIFTLQRKMKRDEEKQKNDIDLGNLDSTTLKLS